MQKWIPLFGYLKLFEYLKCTESAKNTGLFEYLTVVSRHQIFEHLDNNKITEYCTAERHQALNFFDDTEIVEYCIVECRLYSLKFLVPVPNLAYPSIDLLHDVY